MDQNRVYDSQVHAVGGGGACPLRGAISGKGIPEIWNMMRTTIRTNDLNVT
jgi:hypothetical protein